MSRSDAGLDKSTLAVFAGAVLVGGSNFVAVKYSNEELEPTWGAALRFTVAAVLFFAITRARRLELPRGRAFWGAALYGVLGFGLTYFFLYYALLGLTAGTSSVIVASAPLATLILAVLHRQERFTIRGVIGGVLAIGGIGVLSWGSLGGDLSPIYVGSAVLGVLCIGESAVVIKSFPRAHPITTNAVGMGAGAILLVIISILQRDSWVLPSMAETWAAVVWLVIMGSVALFVFYLILIARWSASATNYVVTLMPIVAVTEGAVIADERITVQVLLGGALVLSAVYVGALRRERPPEEIAEPPLAAGSEARA